MIHLWALTDVSLRIQGWESPVRVSLRMWNSFWTGISVSTASKKDRGHQRELEVGKLNDPTRAVGKGSRGESFLGSVDGKTALTSKGIRDRLSGTNVSAMAPGTQVTPSSYMKAVSWNFIVTEQRSRHFKSVLMEALWAVTAQGRHPGSMPQVLAGALWLMENRDLLSSYIPRFIFQRFFFLICSKEVRWGDGKGNDYLAI